MGQTETQPAPATEAEPRPASGGAAPQVRPGRPARPVLPTWALAALFVVAIAGALVVRQNSDVRGRDATTRPGAAVPSPPPPPTAREQPTVVPSPVPVSPTPTPKPAVGTLKISTSPAGARVELDGTEVGVTALILSDVKPGKHSVKISKAGFRSVSRELEVEGGETIILDLTLSAAPPPAPPRRRATPPPPPPPP